MNDRYDRDRAKFDRFALDGTAITPPMRKRVQMLFAEQPHEEIDYRAFWRGIGWGLLFVAPVWLIVFALAWVRWGFGS